jgi:hypothetical protein
MPAEQAYTIKATLAEAFQIREGLARQIAFLEDLVMEAVKDKREPDVSIIRELDAAKRVAARID